MGTYNLVISDYLYAMNEMFPMSKMEAQTLASLIVNEIKCPFGVPHIIHSD